MKILKQILYYVFLPIVAILMLYKLFSKDLSQGAEISIKETEDKDKDLANQQQEHVNAANKALAEADKIEQEKQAIKESDVDVNWHLKQ